MFLLSLTSHVLISRVSLLSPRGKLVYSQQYHIDISHTKKSTSVQHKFKQKVYKHSLRRPIAARINDLLYLCCLLLCSTATVTGVGWTVVQNLTALICLSAEPRGNLNLVFTLCISVFVFKNGFIFCISHKMETCVLNTLLYKVLKSVFSKYFYSKIKWEKTQ